MEQNELVKDGILDLAVAREIIKKNLIERKSGFYGSYRDRLFNSEYRSLNKSLGNDEDVNILYIEEYHLKITYPNIYGVEFNVEICDKPEEGWARLIFDKEYLAPKGAISLSIEDDLVQFSLDVCGFAIDKEFKIKIGSGYTHRVQFDVVNQKMYFLGDFPESCDTDEKKIQHFQEQAKNEYFKMRDTRFLEDEINATKLNNPKFGNILDKLNLSRLIDYKLDSAPISALYGYMLNPDIQHVLSHPKGLDFLALYLCIKHFNPIEIQKDFIKIFPKGKNVSDILELNKNQLKRLENPLTKADKDEIMLMWLWKKGLRRDE